MSIKEDVINEAINRIEKRSSKLESLIYGNPISQVFDLRIKAGEILKKYKGDNKIIAEMFEPMAKEEKRLMRAAQLQTKNSMKWSEEKSKIDFELGQLKTELYCMKQRAT